MNHAYRLVWNQVFSSWVAVPETARGRTKGTGRKLAVAALSLSAVAAHAAPTGGQVVSGSAQISSAGHTTTITQSSQNVSLNWSSFNVGSQETVNFRQPSASAIAVNRIFDTSGTRILGHLNANGQVYLINPNGILFGKGAQVNVGGLVASTLDVDDASLAGGRRSFSGNGTGSVVNQGVITAADGGYVALLGNHVGNEGTIVARLGTVGLGAGSAITLNFDGSSLVGMQVDRSTLDNLAANGGLIQADGGTVVMTAGAKDALLASVVNNTGVVEARTVEDHDGSITLLGGMTVGTVNVGGTLDASAPTGGNGGAIETSAASVKVAAGARVTTHAADGVTGSWLIDPTDFTVAASGGDMTGAALGAALENNNFQVQSTAGASAGSGDININDAVSWDAATTLTLSAQRNITINQSITATSANGKLALQYGLGAVSAGNTATYNVNAPVNLQAGNNFSTQLGSDGAVVQYTVITSLGSQGSVTGTDLQGINGNLSGNYALGGDIDASSTAGWNGGAGFAPIGNNSGSGSFTGSFEGLGHVINGLAIDVSATNASSLGIGLFGMVGSGGVVRDVGLTGASVSVGADNTDIDYDYNYIGGLVGINEGTIVNSYVTGSVTSANEGMIGGLVGENVGTIVGSHSTASVAGGTADSSNEIFGDEMYVGGLVGYNGGGSIANSYATGSVSAGNSGANDYYYYAYIGGLVGWSYGQISNSYATGDVAAYYGYSGGLVGVNEGPLSNSYATGSVSADAGVNGGGNVGGLAGYNDSIVSNSYSTGAVNVGSVGVAGGLIGVNYGTVSNSYSTGAVNGGSAGSVGGLIGTGFGTVTGSFWNTDTSGQATSAAGGVGLTTQQMQTQSSYAGAGWDFASTWVMYDGYTNPLLRSFMTTLVVTANDAHKTYDGIGYSGGNGVTYSVTPNADNLLGTLGYSGTSQGATDVSAGGYTITAGGLYSNQQGYIIVYQGGTLTIDPKTLTVTAGTATKTYDGSTAVTLTGSALTGVVGSDDVALTGNFASANAGNNIGVTLALTGAKADDYTFAQGADPTGSIMPKTLTVSGTTAAGKVYDGTTSATLSGGLLSGVVGDDAVTLSQSGDFATKNVGSGIAVTATDTLSGTAAGNYVVQQPTGLSASITPATLTVGGTTVAGKVYDGTTSATLNGGALSGVIGGDAVTLSQSGTFATKNVGSNIGVTASDTLAGTDAGNYVLQQPAHLSGDITPATLTVSGATVADKVYDGTTSATLNGGALSGLFGSDAVTLSQSGSFGTKNVGNGIAVTTADALSGADAGNYVLQQPTGLAGNITPATLTVSGTTVAGKVYDGTTSATLNGGALSGVIGGDAVALSQSGSFATKNVGSNIGVTASDTLAGTDAGNYVLQQPAHLSGNITPATLTVTGTTVADKVYDGTTSATLNGGALSGLFGSDAVALSQSGTFATKNVGANIAVTTADALSGADAGNYVLQQPIGLAGNITPATLTVSGTTVAGKVYDGTTSATLNGGALSGLIGDDAVALSQSGTFATKNVGTNIAVTTADALSGADAGNYVLQQPTGLAANITPATLTVSGTTVAGKVYDGTTSATLNGGALSGLIGGDAVTLSQSGTFATKNVGSNIGVTASDTLAGTDAGNYVLQQPTGLAANITPATLTVSGTTVAGKVYDGTTSATLNGGALSGVIGGDAVALSQSGTFATKNVGTNIAITTADALSGADAGNYMLQQPTGLAASITPATLTYTAAPTTQVAGATPFTLSGTVTGFVGGDTQAGATSGTLSWTTAAGNQPGSYAVDGRGLSAQNYVFTQAASNATALTLMPVAALPPALTNAIAQLLVPVGANFSAGQFGYVPAPTIVPALVAAAPSMTVTPGPSAPPPPTATFSIGNNGTLQIQNFGVNLPEMVVGLQ
ncbi:YDG domain-containing protein [Paraburkholderia caballeronis]|uniref:YDG domain-containing protein n=1 Tax=Paraburkholderia caballeronis TaxID=416943 RepID=UPI001065DB90|nr:YDG domain-containing protein [Paraburkholderia caballeronis]TDV03999.1 filamentous hemagglutinin family protein [Paraburkholderia caballeronis]TDV07092.1 filamentous hemagglutinin family protein [Paraburkholderia caballeronis]TDV17789.1 filamentous hemagglutinin family protein [Paraburkholderia caballeronis]